MGNDGRACSECCEGMGSGVDNAACADAGAGTAAASVTDEMFMREALIEARQAALEGEVPVGAVVVRDGEIISRAHNLVETAHSSSAHAEMIALHAAEEKLGAKWLSGCTVYVTLEPCSMCAGAMVLARVARLVYGASDPKAGACGSVHNIAANERLNHRIDITAGVLEEECSWQLREFFRAKRAEHKAGRSREESLTQAD